MSARYGSEQSRVYPQRLQITLQRISMVGEPHTSHVSPVSEGGAGCAFRRAPAMEESTTRGGLNPSYVGHGV